LTGKLSPRIDRRVERAEQKERDVLIRRPEKAVGKRRFNKKTDVTVPFSPRFRLVFNQLAGFLSSEQR
jgi:hypothetical protein